MIGDSPPYPRPPSSWTLQANNRKQVNYSSAPQAFPCLTLAHPAPRKRPCPEGCFWFLESNVWTFLELKHEFVYVHPSWFKNGSMYKRPFLSHFYFSCLPSKLIGIIPLSLFLKWPVIMVVISSSTQQLITVFVLVSK